MDPKAAREARGWTIYEASERMIGVSRSSLTHLEEDPKKVGPELKLRTALEVLRVYWPDVDLTDLGFGPRPLFRVAPRDGQAKTILAEGVRRPKAARRVGS